MLDKLTELVQMQAGDSVIQNPAIPNEKNDAVISTAGESITGSLQNLLSGTGAKDLFKLFGSENNASMSNPAVQSVAGDFIGKLISKFGLDQNTATGIASQLIPAVLQKLVHKTNDPGDNSFNVQDIFNQLSNGKTGSLNIQDMVQKATAGRFDTDGDGDTDLQDVMGMFKGGKGGSDLLGSVKSLFGN